MSIAFALVPPLLVLACGVIVDPGPVVARVRLRRAMLVCSDLSSGRGIRSRRLLPMAAGLSLGSVAATVLEVSIGMRLVVAMLIAVGAYFGADRILRTRGGDRARDDVDPLRLAASWDLLAASLRSGLPTPVALRAITQELPAAASAALTATADLMALGSDPVQAWRPARECPQTAELSTVARRTARSGSAMAQAIGQLADDVRRVAADAAEERAQRVGVMITGPLGLCFLPAFLCLGVAPVVIGLADTLLASW